MDIAIILSQLLTTAHETTHTLMIEYNYIL